jgi:hypothetical protein
MSKSEADWCKKIEIWWLLRDIKEKGGYKHSTIRWTNAGEITAMVNIVEPDRYVQFKYALTPYNGEKKSFDYKVQLITTACHLGGRRFWFICPLLKNGIPNENKRP